MPEMLWDDDDALVDDEAETDGMSMDEIRKARLLEATDTFIEALQQISEAKGRDDPDDFEPAVNAIKGMQRIAFNALQLYGFTPRGELVE